MSIYKGIRKGVMDSGREASFWKRRKRLLGGAAYLYDFE
jgi:hypothetical protein